MDIFTYMYSLAGADEQLDKSGSLTRAAFAPLAQLERKNLTTR